VKIFVNTVVHTVLEYRNIMVQSRCSTENYHRPEIVENPLVV